MRPRRCCRHETTRRCPLPLVRGFPVRDRLRFMRRYAIEVCSCGARRAVSLRDDWRGPWRADREAA